MPSSSTHGLDIVFLGVFEIFFALDVIALGSHKKICVFEIIDVVFDGMVGGAAMHQRTGGVGKVVRVGGRDSHLCRSSLF